MAGLLAPRGPQKADNPLVMAELAQHVRRTLDDSESSLARRNVLVMCSGGVDSIVLVDVLASLPRGSRPACLAVLWCDHGLRDVTADRRAVNAVVERHDLHLHAHVWMRDEAAPDDGGLQAAARAWRYGVAEAVAREHNFDVVAVGHHADDQLETLLLGLTSASGLRAAAGMRLSRALAPGITVVRPLLTQSREAILAHASEHELSWAEDPSNASTRYRRNRLRHEVIPALLDIHPGSGANLMRTATQIADAASTIDALAEAVLSSARSAASDALDVRTLQELPADARKAVIIAWLRGNGVGRAITDRTARSIERLAAGDRRAGTVELERACVVRDGYDLQVRHAIAPRKAPVS
jgi:tRNA(Ile)-lysidine synthase